MILVGIYGEPADTGIYDHHTTLAETKAAGGGRTEQRRAVGS